jgi:hypothetical protein
MRGILIHVRYCVDQRFGNNPSVTAKAIGSHLLLRLINPAILLPESYGISPVPPSPEARRQLLLVTKVLQNLANDVRFGNKEQHMSPMNTFLDNNQDSFNQFLLDLGDPASNPTSKDADQRVTTFIQEGEKKLVVDGEEYKTTIEESEGPLTVPEEIYLAHTASVAGFVSENKEKVNNKLREKFTQRGQPDVGESAVADVDRILTGLNQASNAATRK